MKLLNNSQDEYVLDEHWLVSVFLPMNRAVTVLREQDIETTYLEGDGFILPEIIELKSHRYFETLGELKAFIHQLTGEIQDKTMFVFFNTSVRLQVIEVAHTNLDRNNRCVVKLRLFQGSSYFDGNKIKWGSRVIRFSDNYTFGD